MKKCTKCKIDKTVEEFNFRKKTNRYQTECKECEHKRNKDYKLKIKKTMDLNNQKYRDENKETIKIRNKVYRTKNKEAIKDKSKIYRENNRENRNKKEKERRANDSLFRLRANISNLIRKTFKQKNCKKTNKTIDILGCSILEFKTYIQSKFEPWMNFENHGQYNTIKKTWQFDHIIPISSAKTEEDILKLNHYTNFQPLESMENLLKSNKY